MSRLRHHTVSIFAVAAIWLGTPSFAHAEGDDAPALIRRGVELRREHRNEEALELFADDPMRFDLVLTDLTMPGITGTDFARAVLDLRPRTRIVMMTGFSGTWTLEALRSIGVKELVLKPVTVESLATVICAAAGAASHLRRIAFDGVE